jgi:hypothetical protein
VAAAGYAVEDGGDMALLRDPFENRIRLVLAAQA